MHLKTGDVWVLTDGRPGHISQTLGLAEALCDEPIVKRLALRAPYRQTSPFLGWGGGRALTPDSAIIAPPWPKLIVTSGRSAIPVAFGIRRANGGRTKLVNVQDPGYFRAQFDLIVVPEHDALTGTNIMSTAGALGRVTAQRLEEAKARFGAAFDHLPHPRVAALIGGANGVFRSPPPVCERVGRVLNQLAKDGAGLMVSFSRRTGPELENAIREHLADSNAIIWDGTGENPYFAFLGLADHIIATEDSASMVSEAATTGKPISILKLEGSSRKFTRFHDAMAARGVTRPLGMPLQSWSYEPIDETARAAERVRELLL